MPFFPDEWIHELLSKVNIADVVGSYVSLQNKSGGLWACCPFHNEKTPSFKVNTDKGFFHCFGCGKGGDAIHFVMDMEKMSFPESCAFLADRVNLPVPKTNGGGEYEKRKAARQKIYVVNKAAARFFYESLNSDAGRNAKDYLIKRGIGEAVMKTFGVGYAPGSWDSLKNYLSGLGHTNGDMQAAGLIRIKDGKCYDYFRNRVMMPIINTFSEVIGFGGRVMDDSQPKYLNSPETAAFSKGRSLYNLNLVRKQKDIQYIILVEGYMDVISLHAHGVRNCTATLGTALTSDQARLLKKYTGSAFICYDGDEAGKKAAMRAADILTGENMECRVVRIPGGADPDDYIKTNGRDDYLKLLKSALPVIDYKFETAAEKYDLRDSTQKEKYVLECIEVLKSVKSAVVREKYVRKLSGMTGFSENAIARDLGTPAAQNNSVRPPDKAKRTEKSAADMAEEYIIALLCERPDKLDEIAGEIGAGHIKNPVNLKIFLHLLDCSKRGLLPQGDEIISVLDDNNDLAYITALLDGIQVFSEGKKADTYLEQCLTNLKIRAKEEELDGYRQKLRTVRDSEEKRDIGEKMKQAATALLLLKKVFSG